MFGRHLSVFVFSLVVPALAISAEDPWSDVQLRSGEQFDFYPNSPSQFRSLRLNVSAMGGQLSRAPLEPALQDRYPSMSSDGPEATIVLPTPDGKNLSFIVREAPIMAEALALRFPEIRSYSVISEQDPSTVGKISWTPKGLQAMILDSYRGTWLIDPLHQGNNEQYASYLKADYFTGVPMACEFTGEDIQSLDRAERGGGGVTHSGELRTYRLALATTGEYSQFHGGTLNSVMTEINVAMTRVNGVYERDIALRMELIANNDQIIYFNGGTDPYTNNSGVAMLGENQANLDNVIGNANYDVGHVFSTGGGGIARLRAPCGTGIKARGVTGLTQPVNDVFYVDFVAHELGHQWGGNHTFNGDAGSCSGGNRNGATAYEPGSGATIQAYAGICGSQNLQPNSDDYFHGISLDEMIGYSVSGNGNNCAAVTPVSNQAPVVDAGANFTIPANTPFELCGSATDVDGNTLTYAWEEFDLGPAGPPGNPQGNAAIFRSFQPTTSGCRTFPRKSDLLNGTQTIGELLPSYDRTMTFRLNVRDNAVPAGGVSSQEMQVTVEDTGAAFGVISPTGASEWEGGQTETVTWNVAGTDQAPISCAFVDIRLSSDGGQSFTQDVLLNAPNTGTAQVTVPFVATEAARVEVRCAGNVFFNVSSGNFTVMDGDTVFKDGFE